MIWVITKEVKAIATWCRNRRDEVENCKTERNGLVREKYSL
jgi:hypothetical protein